ncbi:MAG: ABC transporter ATP-binding protein [Methylobacterium frigidaeris]
MVTAADVSLCYRGLPVLGGVDLAVRAGEAVALLGPNGAGKTSLMRLLAGRLSPSGGTVRAGGGDPFRSRAVRRAIGWVPQEIALYGRLTVRENLDVFARLAGLKRPDRAPAVERVVGLAGLSEVAGDLVGLLSGGYQRRTNIAVALLAEPALVLLDEPTQGIDRVARAAIHGVLERLRRNGTAILIATHDFAEAERLADRVLVLHGGRIGLDGRLADLLATLRAGPPEHEVALDDAPCPSGTEILRGAGFEPSGPLTWHRSPRRRGASAEAESEGTALLAHLRRHGVPVREIRVREPGLDALYLDAIGARDGAAGAPVPAS